MKIAGRGRRIAGITVAVTVALVSSASFASYRVSHPIPWAFASLSESTLQPLLWSGNESFAFSPNGVVINYFSGPGDSIAGLVRNWRIVGKQLIITEDSDREHIAHVFIQVFASRRLLIVARSSGGRPLFFRVLR